MADSQHIFTRTIQGVSANLLRQAVVLPLGVVVSIALARLLDPVDFGIFAVVLLLTEGVSSFRDLGVSSALVYQSREPGLAELRTAFTVQMLLCGLFYGSVVLLIGPILKIFHLPESAALLIKVVALSVFLLPFNSISQVSLQRSLRYTLGAKIDFLQTLSYSVVALTLAALGFGVWSFGIAYLGSMTLRTVVMFAATRWPVGFAFDIRFLRESLPYGIRFQGSLLLSVVRNNIPALVAGPLFGPQVVGYLNWAQRITQQIAMTIANMSARVMFASLARLKDDREGLSAMVRVSMRYLAITSLPLIALLWGFAPEIVDLIYSAKWAPAIPALYLFAAATQIQAFTVVPDNLLKGIGDAATTLKIIAAWVATTIIAGAALGMIAGFVGVAAGALVGAILGAVLFRKAIVPHASPDLIYALLRPTIAAICVLITILTLKNGRVDGLVSLAVSAGLGALEYGLILWIMERGALTKDIHNHFRVFRKSIFEK